MSFIFRFFILLVCTQAIYAQAASELLTNAVDVLSLPADRASTGIKVSIQGVVTAAQSDWHGRFFVQDATAGIFVENISEPQPAPGDLVRVTGVSNPGGFAPIISRPHVEKLGTAPLPAAKIVSIEKLMSGIEDSQRVEISGLVRTAKTEQPHISLQIISGGYRLQALVPRSAAPNPQSLVGATVRVRGTAAATFKPQMRHLVAMNVFVPSTNDFIVEKLESTDPFDEPAVSIKSLAQYRREPAASKRVHVRGIVTYQRPGEDMFLQDATGGLQIRSSQTLTVKHGTVVEAVGFTDFENFLPVLQEGMFRMTETPPNPVVTRSATLREMQEGGRHHGDLITLKGKLLDRMVRHAGSRAEHAHTERVTLTLQATNYIFTVEGPAAESNAKLTDLAIGSTIEVTGVCMLHIDSNGALESVQLLLPRVGNLRVLQRPSWLTPGRLLIGLVLLFVILILAVSWTVTLSRKNGALKMLIRDKVKTQAELQQAHDLLEQRVNERTAQLKFEITARKEAEVHFKATLGERTRLAQELHDTLEQSLAGIGLQLDAASKLFETRADGSKGHLELARNLMTQCQKELRRSIWDLRSRELEQFDLPNALQVSAREILTGTNVEVKFETVGQIHPLSEVVEENLLRIGREALTNVIKHASARRVTIRMEFVQHAVKLQIVDDGRGFYPDNCPGVNERHFGILGMSERAKRLEGHFRLVSAPGSGTRLEVEIPMRVTNGSATAGHG